MSELSYPKENMSMEKEEISLFKQRNFLLLWIATIFSSLSISVFMFSQTWYVVQVLDLEASLGFIFIASSVPRLLFMAIGGALADRMSKTLIMVISDISRAILVAGLVLLLLFDVVSLWTFVGFALIFGILDAFFWPASGSLLPTIIPKSQLMRANSLMQTSNQFFMIFGPMIAGFVIIWGGYAFSFGMTAILLFIASFMIYYIKLASNRKGNESEESQKSMLNSVREGFTYVKQSAFLSTLMIVSVFINLLFAGPMMMGLPLFVKNILGGSTLDFSMIEGSLAFGMLFGAVLAGLLNLEKKRGLVAVGAIGIMSVLYLLLSQTNYLWQSMLVIFMQGIFLSVANIPLISVIQSIVEDKMIGRVMSLLSISSMGLIPVSFALTSLFLSISIPIDMIMLSAAALLLMLVSYVLLKVPAIIVVD
jgi:MFS family permease